MPRNRRGVPFRHTNGTKIGSDQPRAPIDLGAIVVGWKPPHSRPIALLKRGLGTNGTRMPDRSQTLAKVLELIEPFNKKGVAITEATRFAQDLEWDSLTVLDFVANVEDEFDVLISMNMQAEIETVGQLVDALERLKA